MSRPDFEAAVQAAPEWVRTALLRLNEYEQQLESK